MDAYITKYVRTYIHTYMHDEEEEEDKRDKQQVLVEIKVENDDDTKFDTSERDVDEILVGWFASMYSIKRNEVEREDTLETALHHRIILSFILLIENTCQVCLGMS